MMRVAAIQMTSGTDVGANLSDAADMLGRASNEGVRLAVLPENFGFLSRRDSERREVAELPGDGPMQAFLREESRRLGMTLVGGTIPVVEADDSRPRSRCLVMSPDGEQLASYDKIHLFDVNVPGGTEHYRESSSTCPGTEACCCALSGTPVKLGLSVCYDLRFPELYRVLAGRGVNLFTVPAAFTVPTGKAHWELLLRARAVENLSFVIGAGQCGEHPGGRRTWGHSMIIAPWGETLAAAGSDPGVICADLDFDALTQMRREFPVLEHRRLSG